MKIFARYSDATNHIPPFCLAQNFKSPAFARLYMEYRRQFYELLELASPFLLLLMYIIFMLIASIIIPEQIITQFKLLFIAYTTPVIIFSSFKISSSIIKNKRIQASQAFLFIIYTGILTSALLFIYELFGWQIELNDIFLYWLIISFITIFTTVTIRLRQEKIASIQNKT